MKHLRGWKSLVIKNTYVELSDHMVKFSKSIALTASASFKNMLPGLSYYDGDTFLHRLNPTIKLILLICYSILVFVLSDLIPSIILFIGLLLVNIFIGLGLNFFLKKIRLILIFGIMIFMIQIFTIQEGILLFEYSLFRGNISVWTGGLGAGLVLMLRFINVIGASYVFITTTDPNKLSYNLMQLGLPYRFGFMLITALRFIPVFHQELATVRNAQRAKGIVMEGLRLKSLIKVTRYLLIPLVISALNKVDTLSVSMESRAFGLHPRRTYLNPQGFNKVDWIVLCSSLLVFTSFLVVF